MSHGGRNTPLLETATCFSWMFKNEFRQPWSMPWTTNGNERAAVMLDQVRVSSLNRGTQSLFTLDLKKKGAEQQQAQEAVETASWRSSRLQKNCFSLLKINISPIPWSITTYQSSQILTVEVWYRYESMYWFGLYALKNWTFQTLEWSCINHWTLRDDASRAV